MSNRISEIVDEIQYRHKLTHEQIANKIGYSRPYFTDALAGIDKKLTCHVSRHTFANQMFQEFGVEGIGLISRALGHTTEATTRNYVLPLANDGISKKVSEFYSKIKK